VDAKAPPSAPTLVPVKSWEDVVKAADTLGAPIVRVVRPTVTGPTDATSTAFYVVSGTTGFVYVHGGGPGAPPLPPIAMGPAGPAKSVSAAVRDWHDRYPRIPDVDTASLDAFVAWSDRIHERLRWFRPSSSLRRDSEELLLRAIGLAQRGRLDAAWVILGQLYGRLGPWDAPKRGGSPPPPPPASLAAKPPTSRP
jgi:hypothetical protein